MLLFDGLNQPYFHQDGSTFSCCELRPIQGEAETQNLPVMLQKFAFVICFNVFFLTKSQIANDDRPDNLGHLDPINIPLPCQLVQRATSNLILNIVQTTAAAAR